MKDLKTTTSGILAGIFQLLPLLGVPIPEIVSQVGTGLAILLLGYFAKDSKKEQP